MMFTILHMHVHSFKQHLFFCNTQGDTDTISYTAFGPEYTKYMLDRREMERVELMVAKCMLDKGLITDVALWIATDDFMKHRTMDGENIAYSCDSYSERRYLNSNSMSRYIITITRMVQTHAHAPQSMHVYDS